MAISGQLTVTPEELAVAITAEMIAVRRRGKRS